MPTPTHWIWVFGEIRGLRWVLKHGTMAFAEHSWSRVKTMKPGDEVILYVTRGAFHSPTKDRARLAGLATVTSEPRQGDPVQIAGRDFSSFVDFEAKQILPERQGPEIGPLAEKLERVKRPEVWGHYFRNSPIRISRADYEVLAWAVRLWRGERG